MKIAIVERNTRSAEKIRQVILDWSRERRFQGLDPIVFDSVQNLRYELEDGQHYDLVFLDLAAAKTTEGAVQLVQAIRRRDVCTAVVWIAESKDHTEAAFELEAYQYLVKPFDAEKVYRVLDRLMLDLKKHRERIGEFNGVDGRLRLSFDDILYVEAATKKHHTFIHMTDGKAFEIILSGHSFRQLAQALLSERFIRCHRSFIVNQQYVTAVSVESVTLSYTKEVPASRHFLQNFTDPPSSQEP
ncbi:MAG: response regulator transcription factor [Lachnospiraceae bacterium]|nr:response regulator transcription factor [Lachnospiraceae bacterium]